MRKLTLASLVGVLLVTGCGSGVTKDASYETAADLRAALQAAGLPCETWSDDDTTSEFDAGECDGMQIRVYPDTQARELDAKGIIIGGMATIMETEQSTRLVMNRNWSAYVPPREARGIARQMGGEVVNPVDYDLSEMIGLGD